MSEIIVNTALFVERLMRLARENPGLPIALIDDGRSVQVGVLNIYDLNKDDWYEKPVSVEQFTAKVPKQEDR